MSRSISAVCRNITPSATLRLNAIVNEKRAQGLDIIGMGAGEPDFPTPAAICAAAKQAIDTGKTKYTAANGIPELRKAVGAHVNRLYGLTYGPNEVIIGTGAKQVLMEALIAILDPGDEVILPAPCWLSYPEMIRMAGGVPAMVLTTAQQGFLPSMQALSDAITPRTKAILINTPNNPTGAVWGENLLREVAQLAVQHDLFIISDEIYETLVFSGARHVPIATLGDEVFERTITISGWSKAYAMTGWRLGYALGPKDVINAMGAYQSHATGNPNSIAQYAALEALQGPQDSVEDMRLAFERRRDLMLELSSGIPGIACAPPQGAFYVLMNIQGLVGKRYQGQEIRNDEDFTELLLEHKLVSVVSGTPFCAPNCVRLSYAIADDTIREAMRRIAEFVKELT
ncbi:MAG TPA: pyridoxal phosphate-dependent aminotransferase [Clostridiales bacterium]|nr:pyridoxal phosphate-dependent aminotransferase [Clostridiales bacterium]